MTAPQLLHKRTTVLMETLAAVLVILSIVTHANCLQPPSGDQCYDYRGAPLACDPPSSISNIVAGEVPDVTSTCGTGQAERVCEISGLRCDICDSSSQEKARLPSMMTDSSADTYWQSETYRKIRETGVNITFHFRKTYILEEIRITFRGPRPDSFALYIANNSNNKKFSPLQYFSKSCQETYGLSIGTICTSDGVGLIPLTGGKTSWVASSPTLATSLQIRLDRLSTLGNEHTWNNTVLDSYSYSISDIVIRGRCYCNGHGSACTTDIGGQVTCLCSHNTTGRDCEMCLPSYNDLEWFVGNHDHKASECQKCNCNGRSNTCHFDAEVFRRSGNVSGGVCDNCTANTAGINCLECSEGYYPDPHSSNLKCIPCICDPRGVNGSNGTCSSAEVLHNKIGYCPCKENVEGQTCNTCRSGFFNLTDSGCQSCSCYVNGSIGIDCDSVNGQCTCISKHYYGRTCQPCDCHMNLTLDDGSCDKNGICNCQDGVGGDKCDHCLSGYYNLAEGCIECSCNINGSIGIDCHPVTGQCTCQTGFSGRDCSLCPDGTHKIEQGCVECPECYDEVSQMYNETISKLDMIISAVNRSLNTTKIDKEVIVAFNETSLRLLRLKELLRNITERREYILKQLLEIQMNLTEVENKTKILEKILNDTVKVGNFLEESTNITYKNITMISSEIKIINSNTVIASVNLTTALDLATKISKIVENLASITVLLERSALNQSLTIHELQRYIYLLSDNTTDLLYGICEVLDVQNNTLNLLEGLVDCSSDELDDLLKLAEVKLQTAIQNASRIFNDSVRFYSLVNSIILPGFNSSKLLVDSNEVLTNVNKVYQKGLDVLDTTSYLNDNFTSLYSEAQLLFRKIESLNRTAADIIARERGARRLANATTIIGEELIREIEDLLSTLLERLQEQMAFISKLENVTAIVEKAESVSNSSFLTAEKQKSVVEEIIKIVRDSQKVLNNTEATLLQTESVIRSTLTTVNITSDNTQRLINNTSSLQDLFNNTEESVERLQERGKRDREAIESTHDLINTTVTKANSLESSAENIVTILNRLERDLNSTVPLSEEAYSRVLQSLESAEVTFYKLEESLRNATVEIEHLESQHEILDKKYVQLQLKRDLLSDLRKNLEKLNCETEFV